MATAVFASPALRDLIRQRLGQLGAIALLVAALVLLVALGSYDPHDPSLNTATARGVGNLAGTLGAITADLALQYLGLAAALPVLAMLAWAYRMASSRPVRLGERLVALGLGLPAAAAALATLPGALPAAAAWPTGAGPGGAVGAMLAAQAMAMGQGLLGPTGTVIVLGAGWLLAALLAILALGLTGGEWRAAGRGAVGVMRGSVRGGRGAAGLATRGARLVAKGAAGAGQRVSAPLFRAVARPEPELEPGRDADALPPRPVRPTPAASGAASGASSGTASGGTPEEKASASDSTPHSTPDSDASFPTVPKPKIAAMAKPLPPRREEEPVEAGWEYPPLSLLSPAPRRQDSGPGEDALQANARLLETVLSDYGVQGTIREIRPGPVVTLYELEPAPGIRSARVIGLADDVARSLSVSAVRIATVSGRNAIGIEVPNAKRQTVFLSELLSSEEWRGYPGKLALALGKDISGAPVVADLARMPHLLIAGTTGSGKSVGINAMILSLLYRMSPDQCRLIMIDPKMLELSVYEGIPHLLAPVVTDPARAVTALKWTTREMERRYRAMSQLGVRNVGGYNERVAESMARGETVTRRVQTGFDSETGKPVFDEVPLTLKPLPFIVVVIDEMADLMMVAGKEVEAAVQRLAQMARAAGIHVIMATQRPSVDVITGTIKANFPTRISFQVISKFDSRTILGEQGAEQLLGQGDLLHMAGGGRIARVHGPFVADREVEDIVAFLRAQAEPDYDDEVTDGGGGSAEDDDGLALSGIAGGSDGEKGLFDQAVAIVSREGKASTSFLQRHLSIGYNRAAKLIEQMEKEGIITPANHVGKREVLARVSRDDDE